MTVTTLARLTAQTAALRAPAEPRRPGRSEARSDAMLFQLAIENMAQGLFMLDADQKIIVINKQVLDIYNLPAGIIKVGATAYDIVEQSLLTGNYPGLTLEAAWAGASQRLAAKKPWRLQQRLGNGKVIEIAYAPMPEGGWVTTHLDVTERQNAEDRLAYLARHDALTGLANRSALLSILTENLATNTPVTLFYLDLDRFKLVNDTLGHPQGDELLRQVAARLGKCVRETDTVARLGGDEFAIVKLSRGRGQDDSRMARRIIAAIAAPFDLGDHRVQIGASVGIATAPHGGTAKVLLKHADTALYRAKSDGRGTFRLFEPGMDLPLEQRRTLELDLRNAIAREEFELHYQPLVHLATNAVIGFEALIRWQHPVRGLVPPMDFIPLAEETGLIVPIGEWALRTACAEAAKWPAHLGVAVNLSAVQFRKDGLVAAVQAALAASGLPPSRLELEITETVLMHDRASSAALLSQFRAMGITLALDDFGTGYSSLSYLRSFQFDKIKIDRSFIQDLTEKDDCRAIVRAIVALGQSLGIHVLAEGVETPDQLDMLQTMGCTSVQGYLLGHPKPAQDLHTIPPPSYR